MIHIEFGNSKPKNRWQRTKRYFYRWCDLDKPIVMTVIAVAVKTIVVVILLAYFGAVIMFFWSLP